MAQFTFELFDPAHTLYLSYFTKVSNSSQLRDNVDKFECAFINPQLICSILQIFSAGNRALFNKQNNSPKTHTIYGDLIYYLSPATNVSDM